MIDPPDRLAFWQHEAFLIGLRRQSAGDAPITGVGDSLIAAMSGLGFYNTGLSGGRISTISERIVPTLKYAESPAAILLVGTNNALIEDANDPELVDFQGQYLRLCQSITSAIPRLMVMTIPPIEKGRWNDLLAVALPKLSPQTVTDRIHAFNRSIEAVAREGGYGLFDLNAMMRGSDLSA